MVARSARDSAAAERADSGSARVDSSAVLARVDWAASTADAHSAWGARLDDSAPAGCLAVPARIDWAASTVDDHSARVAQQDGSFPADSVVSAPAGSAALMADDSAERDWPLPDARSEQAGCPGDSPVGSQEARWRVGPVWQHSAGSQAPHCRVGLVWQHPVGSQVGSAGSRGAPCSVSPVFPEVPV